MQKSLKQTQQNVNYHQYQNQNVEQKEKKEPEKKEPEKKDLE